jgi:hypothetical protein
MWRQVLERNWSDVGLMLSPVRDARRPSALAPHPVWGTGPSTPSSRVRGRDNDGTISIPDASLYLDPVAARQEHAA